MGEAVVVLQQALEATGMLPCTYECKEQWVKELKFEGVSREEAQKRLLAEESVREMRRFVGSAKMLVTNGILRAVVNTAVEHMDVSVKREAMHAFVDEVFERLSEDGLRIRVEKVFGVVLSLLCLATAAPVTEELAANACLSFSVFVYRLLQSVWNVKRTVLCGTIRCMFEVDQMLRGGDDVGEEIAKAFESEKEELSRNEFVGMMSELFNCETVSVRRVL